MCYKTQPELCRERTNECLTHLQVGDLQSAHVQTDHITGGGEAVVRVSDVAERGLGEELLLCQRPVDGMSVNRHTPLTQQMTGGS